MLRLTTIKRLLAGVALCLALVTRSGSAELPLTNVPIPKDRPAPVAAEVADDGIATSSVSPRVGAADAIDSSENALARLKAGLAALSAGDLETCLAYRDHFGLQTLDGQILDWAIALSGHRALSSRDIAAAANRLAGWPGLSIMRANSEHALFRANVEPRAVVDAFGGAKPQTTEGVFALARALISLGRKDDARQVLSDFWRFTKLSAGQERGFLREFGRLVPSSVHRFRMERMLYEYRIASATRVAKLAGAEDLLEAWAAVIRRKSNASQLLHKVPSNQRSAGFLFAYARHLRRQGEFQEAATILKKAPRDPMLLVDPDEWWTERRVLSRELLDAGEVKLAYETAAGHAAASAAAIADAEFHAGWYALRGLRNARAAMRHFARVAEVTSGPISQARAYYWMGRSAAEGGPGNATALFERAARYKTTFYGQLAAASLGTRHLAISYPEPTTEERQQFTRRKMVRVIRRLEDADYHARATIIYGMLAEELPSAGELALLAVMAEDRGDHRLALRIGKTAAQRDIDIGALAHPLGAIPARANIKGRNRMMAYAVARQESEFNASAVSQAGARGLLQLMPGTAREMARKTGLGYSNSRLVRDAAYNAQLGTAYLMEQLDRFDGSFVMTFAAYNAGPFRVQQWVERYGDPRGKPVDWVVDWIERIPFAETRNYVQRVMENYQVYRVRLDGTFDIAGDLVRGN